MFSHNVLNKIYFCQIEKCISSKSVSNLPVSDKFSPRHAMLYRINISFCTCGAMIQLALKGKRATKYAFFASYVSL